LSGGNMASAKGKKRRTTLIVFLILLITFLIWIYWGNTSIQVTEIGIDVIKSQIPCMALRLFKYLTYITQNLVKAKADY